MEKKFTTSQKLRLSLWAYWKRNKQEEYSDFEDFYTDFMAGVQDNIDTLVKVLDL